MALVVPTAAGGKWCNIFVDGSWRPQGSFMGGGVGVFWGGDDHRFRSGGHRVCMPVDGFPVECRALGFEMGAIATALMQVLEVEMETGPTGNAYRILTDCEGAMFLVQSMLTCGCVRRRDMHDLSALVSDLVQKVATLAHVEIRHTPAHENAGTGNDWAHHLARCAIL
jgi:outer membrane murein-binding lipoprotein Lpp